MRIALCSTYVPFIDGGARNIVDWLGLMLENAGHKVEKVYLPEVDDPELLFKQIMAFRWIDLEMADRIICFRPESHLIPHHHKILWFIHHIRVFYDLWESPYRGFPDNSKNRGIREALRSVDNNALREAKRIFTNSKVISKRLLDFNSIDSEVLLPPVYQPERFHCRGFNDEIVYISRLEHHKRQHLLIEALQYTKTPVKIRISGSSSGIEYPLELTKRIKELKLENRVIFDNRWITEEDKVEILSNCLAVAYLPLDEDSYGYPCIEASHSMKPILTTLDSGGVLELVVDGFNGYIAEAKPEAIANIMDKLFLDRKKTIMMGKNAKDRLIELNISWAHVIERLLA